jgi:uncharacterized membrane-anchored protein
VLPRWATLALAILIGLVWAANVVVGMFDPTRANPYVSAIFMVVVGAVFGLDRLAQRRNQLPPPPAPGVDDSDRGDQA